MLTMTMMIMYCMVDLLVLASMQHRPQERSFGMVMKEVDKDLALFLEMRNRENVKGDLFFNEKLDGVDDLTEVKCEEILIDGVEDGKDLNWLLTGPGTTLCVPLDVKRPTSLEDRNENPNSPALASRSSRPTTSEDSASLKSKSMQPAKPANIKSSSDGNRRPTSSGGIRSEDSASLKSKSMQPAKPANIKSSADGNRRPTSSGGIRPMSSRPATPTGRPSLPVMSKPSRSSTPNSRVSGSSLKTVVPAMRSSTPTRVTARSSTPTARSSVPSSSKSVSRSATPTPSAISSTLSTAKLKSRSATPTSTARSSTPSTTKTSSRSATPTYKNNSTLSASSGESSTVAKMEPTILINSVPSRGASPTVESRPSKHLSTSATKRPNSASRVRPSAANSCSSLMEASSTGKSRQQSCSPSRVRPSNVNSRRTGPAMLSKSYGYGSTGDDVNPILIGTQMVERVVNMRKLAPSKQDDHHSDTISSKKSSTSQENSGFGRSLSKKSLDMAIRHMDLTRSIAGDIRLSKVSASASPFNVRNGAARSKTTPVSNSQFSTSSNASSEPNLRTDSEGQTEKPIDNCDTNSDRISLPIDFQQDP
ncbi:hypothetical protein LIER_28156 [Lithospermum erythrorhizon]|uniref:Uncharacterized protein n=1 Tax=Lithospermum erythrorhizon TaxID=34254 RepID=A0AAV3RIH1_LITER